jgi:hypothetical protein
MDDKHKIVVEVPNTSGNFTPIQQATKSKLELFRQGWQDAIALPDNLPDLLFDITASITIPALVSSCWVSLPLPSFIHAVGAIAFVVFVLLLSQMLAIPEVQKILAFRLALITVGVVLGL